MRMEATILLSFLIIIFSQQTSLSHQMAFIIIRIKMADMTKDFLLPSYYVYQPSRTDGYDVKGGQFLFLQCAFGIDFKPDMMVQMIFDQRNYTHGTLKPKENGKFTKLGMSLQLIARRTTNILDRVLLE
ncbi:hypothetical protein PGT21_026336 [Puccinia graminis f. sp. tritici]|uniref:Tet-like 2OG-Fe(II) oxygenase domain-containing protein n=1 Tax=Puccinia graminis f. sp. tritici TaxID=56615 RepID=A0A5B0MCX2_PUCGR|nr:hypothetical protein PGT21_026336 [Puccinia graminis f. sp. tritici]KAA1086274.1 hypothetical protein PGTUg99_017968 [Puccinia graminis f. sp. tritici]